MCNGKRSFKCFCLKMAGRPRQFEFLTFLFKFPLHSCFKSFIYNFLVYSNTLEYYSTLKNDIKKIKKRIVSILIHLNFITQRSTPDYFYTSNYITHSWGLWGATDVQSNFPPFAERGRRHVKFHIRQTRSSKGEILKISLLRIRSRVKFAIQRTRS
jgi:hypothetical protein